MHPEDFIRSTWIRPEDTAYYEEAGISSLKFIDRGMTSAALTRITKAYIDRYYAGNLFDLFMMPTNSASFNKMDLRSRFRYFFRPRSINIFKLMKGIRLVSDWGVFIDNRALDGFIQHFLEHNCEDTTCEECRYCHNVSMRAVKIERRKEAFEKYSSYQESLTSGNIFKYL
jgi:collagenase-like PrtC family protease